jgi:hypothetical protein
MREEIYKFLDRYVGDGVRCKFIHSGFRTWSEYYDVVSDNGTIILSFSVKLDQVKVFRSESLCLSIHGYFGVEIEESWKYVRDWFGVKHNIKVLSDLLKLILKEENGKEKVS